MSIKNTKNPFFEQFQVLFVGFLYIFAVLLNTVFRHYFKQCTKSVVYFLF